MLIRSWHERKARAEQKNERLLEFLCSEIWTMYPTIGWLIGDGSQPAARQSVHTLVSRLEDEGLLRTWRPTRISDTDKGGRQVYVGITRKGRIKVGADPEKRVFDPSKLGDASRRNHKMYAQKIRILLTFRGWSDWDIQQRDEDGYPYAVQADYVCTRNGEVAAIEAERTLKSASRYKSVWEAHIDAARNGRWDRVIYYLPSSKEKASFEAIRQRSAVGRHSLFKVKTVDELLSEV